MPDSEQFLGPSWSSDHTFGDCMVNHHRKLFLVNIPKCASSWVKEYLALLGDTPENTWVGGNFLIDDLDDYQPLVILRDPVSRWISHCPLGQNLYDLIREYETDTFFFTNLRSTIYKDEHTAPQTDFIRGVRLSKAIYFLADENLSKKFERYIVSQRFSRVDLPDYVNRSPDDADTLQRKNIWRDLLSVAKYRQQFEEVYVRDYDLIRSVQFY